MSRLDSFIRRLTAQRACLDAAAAAIADVAGPVFELGLGNGRTYDHLREVLSGREIFVFDRRVGANPASVPDDDHLFLGDVTEQLPIAQERFGRTVALVHSDIGTGVAARDAELAAALSPLLAGLVAPGGCVVSDQALDVAAWQAMALPEGVAPGRYFMYRAPRG